MSLTYATLTVGAGEPVNLHFNPSSLRVSTTNQFNEDVPNAVAKPTAFKLDVELLFDTTETGMDVHRETRDLRWAAIATAEGAVAHDDAGADAQNVNSKEPASHLQLVTLTWGTRRYQGYVESLNETLDYWSSDGVPLRATVQISIKGTTRGFLDGKYSDIKNYTDNPVPSLPKVVKASTAKDNTEAFLKAAKSMAGDRSTGRGLAALNGIENMRGGVGAFAGASASAGSGAGAGAFAGASAGASASAGAGAFAGASASAGAGVAVGASAQLQAAAGFKMAGGISAGASAGFGIGASAGLSASAGLGASVGVGMTAGAGFGAGAGIGMGGGIGIGGGIGAGIGMSAGAGIGIGGSASGGGFGVTTSVTGFDGVTTTKSSFTGLDGTTTRSTVTTQGSAGGIFGSASAGITASGGAFAGLGTSRTTLPSAGFNPDLLLPPPLPATGPNASYDVSGRVVSNNGQVAASYSASAGVTVW